jgi:hypothetical protein
MPISPPIRLRQLAEAFVIEDADGTAIACIYFEDDRIRRDAENLRRLIGGFDLLAVADEN